MALAEIHIVETDQSIIKELFPSLKFKKLPLTNFPQMNFAVALTFRKPVLFSKYLVKLLLLSMFETTDISLNSYIEKFAQIYCQGFALVFVILMRNYFIMSLC